MTILVNMDYATLCDEIDKFEFALYVVVSIRGYNLGGLLYVITYKKSVNRARLSLLMLF